MAFGAVSSWVRSNDGVRVGRPLEVVLTRGVAIVMSRLRVEDTTAG